MASFASSATMGGARKHAWTNLYLVNTSAFGNFQLLIAIVLETSVRALFKPSQSFIYRFCLQLLPGFDKRKK